jgi:23S rRNA pseudouridine1911/1915/1917 synthase
VFAIFTNLSNVATAMTMFHEHMLVPIELAGQRLDKVAAQMFDDFSRAELARFIESGDLKVDGQCLKGKHKLLGGERLELEVERANREAWDEAEPIELDLIYEDEHLLVINKPAGLVVHPGAGNRSGTLVNGLLHYRAELAQLPRAGVVHRLDKDTSGIMVVAASARGFRRLTSAIQAREIHRAYVAVSEGRMVAGADIAKPIGRDPHVRTRQAVRDDGKPAFTSVRVLERYRIHTLVKAELESGRTHQIRVHMQSIGHPLVGDSRYGARGKVPTGASQETLDCIRAFKRQALHAEQLCFLHPESDSEMTFTAPWPVDFAELVDVLRQDAVDRE